MDASLGVCPLQFWTSAEPKLVETFGEDARLYWQLAERLFLQPHKSAKKHRVLAAELATDFVTPSADSDFLLLCAPASASGSGAAAASSSQGAEASQDLSGAAPSSVTTA